MGLPTILIPLTIQFNIRYIVRTGLLDEIQKFSIPVFVLGWDDPILRDELQSLGYTVYTSPTIRVGKHFTRIRKKINLVHFDKIRSPSTRIDNYRRCFTLPVSDRLRMLARDSIFRIEHHLLSGWHRWAKQEQFLLETDTNFYDFCSLVDEIKPDIVFSLTPYLIEEEFLIRAALCKPVKLITAILSFDNLTTRPRIPILFDVYLLWNEYNRQELLRIYPQSADKRIEIVGAPQFDFYHNPAYLWEEAKWRDCLRIPRDRPVILFGAGPNSIAPVEPHIVAQLDTAIENGKIRDHPIILVRLHPVDNPIRWDSLRLSAKNLIFDLPWQFGNEIAGKTNVNRYDIEKLVSTLKYSQVHVNASSTMAIDGAIFDRPQIGLAYDDQPGKRYDRVMRELYWREHYLPITNSGGLQIAYSIEQLIAKVNEGFEAPARYSEGRKKMIHEICTYDDGKSTERVVKAISKYLHE